MKYLKYILAFVVIVALIYFALVGMGAYSPEVFAATSAALIAAIFERFAWLKKAWDEITDPDIKQLIMFLFMLVLVGGAYGLSCLNVIVAFTCDGAGAGQALLTLAIALGVNQGAFMVAHKR